MSRGDTLWKQAHDATVERLAAERGDRPYWLGRLADSALATATAVTALHLADPTANASRVQRGLAWLAADRNDDGGWGDSPESISNPSCTALVLSAYRICGRPEDAAGQAHLDSTGGLAAIPERYGSDRTFSAPILTHAALAGLVDWSEIPALPLELAALPRWTFRLGPMPVVSYALPALIAIGLAHLTTRPPRNLLIRLLRRAVTGRILRRLEAIQPASGGFLAAAPLTSFVAMCLIAAGRDDHPVTRRAVAFLGAAQRECGAWAVDENLSVWNTTMAVNGLGAGDADTRAWLLAQQNRARHPYTNSPPGGWGWSHLPGSVPDADDTAGALLALAHLPACAESAAAAADGLRWLAGLQNRDGGWPTFCRGWGKLPFDRSAPDLTAHALRAVAVTAGGMASRHNEGRRGLRNEVTQPRRSHTWLRRYAPQTTAPHMLRDRADRAIKAGLGYLTRTQRPDGSWLPLWFGSQHTADQTNPVFGTARVLAAWRDLDLMDAPPARSARAYLMDAACPEGGWGAAADAPATIEETAVALDALADAETLSQDSPVRRGTDWLARRIADGGLDEPSPIGLYFARLWYHERMYPISLSAAALRRVLTAAGMV